MYTSILTATRGSRHRVCRRGLDMVNIWEHHDGERDGAGAGRPQLQDSDRERTIFTSFVRAHTRPI